MRINSQNRKKVGNKFNNECFLSTPTLFKKDKVICSPAFKYGNGLSCKLQYKKKNPLFLFL